MLIHKLISRRLHTPPIVFFALLGFASGSVAHAQVLYGTLNGNVVDSGGASVPSASVTAKNEGTGQLRETSTSSAGAYSFQDLLAGTYTVTTRFRGFQTNIQQAVVISANNALRLEVSLRPGGMSQTVTVDSTPPALQTDRTDVRTELSGVTLESAPVPVGRNYQNLLRTVPGVSVSGGGTIRGSNPSGSLTMNVNGSPSNSNSTTIDGAISSNTYDSTLVAYVPTLESLESIDVVTNSFTAESSMAGGAAVSLHMKSGTNSLHGSVFEDFSGDALQARPAIIPTGFVKPNYSYNQYGGTLGGPIRKNKLFFFGSFEGIKWNQTYTAFSTVPTVAAKAGNLSESSTPIYDPSTGNTNGTGRTAFAGNIIRQARISPITQKLLALIPDPNLPGLANNYFTAAPSPYRRYTGDGKINWNVSDKLLVFVRAGISRFSQYNATVFGTVLGGPTVDGQQSGNAYGGVDSVTGAATYIFTPNLILDGYFGYTRNIQNAEQDRLSENLGLNFLGIPGTNGTRSFEGGWPLIAIDGYSNLGVPDRGLPWHRINPTYEYTSNINWTRGAHRIRAGLDISQRDLNFIQPNVVGNLFPGAGGFQFSNGVTQLNRGPGGNQDNAFAAFLLGLPLQEGRTAQIPDQYSYFSRFYGVYGQDQWNITPKLTATLGVRWDFYPFGHRGDRGLEIYDQVNNQMKICGVADVPKDCGVHTSKTMFSPRLGIAWRPVETTVVRAGFATTYDPYDIVPQSGFQNYPVDISTVQTGLTSYQSVGDWKNGIAPLVAPDISSGHVALPSTAIIYTPPTDIRRGYIESWNVSVQQELGAGLVGQISYVANHGVRLMGTRDLNAGQTIGAGVAGQPFYQSFGRTASTFLAAPLFASTYEALQATLQKNLAHGVQLSANYTWSKAIGTNNGGGFVPAPQYFYLNRAILSFNRAQVFNLTAVFESPFGKGKRFLTGGIGSRLAEGWQLNPLLTFESGLPFTVTSSGTSLNLPSSTQVANRVKPNVQILGGKRTGNYYFDPLAFAAVTTPQFGNAGFNSLIGPGIMDLDLGLFRSFPITDRLTLQFRGEAFNATNTPHWSNPASNVSSLSLNPDGSIKSSGGFAQITSTNASSLGRSGSDQRTFRLSVHMKF